MGDVIVVAVVIAVAVVMMLTRCLIALFNQNAEYE